MVPTRRSPSPATPHALGCPGAWRAPGGSGASSEHDRTSVSRAGAARRPALGAGSAASRASSRAPILYSLNISTICPAGCIGQCTGRGVHPRSLRPLRGWILPDRRCGPNSSLSRRQAPSGAVVARVYNPNPHAPPARGSTPTGATSTGAGTGPSTPGNARRASARPGGRARRRARVLSGTFYPLRPCGYLSLGYQYPRGSPRKTSLSMTAFPVSHLAAEAGTSPV